MASFVKKVIDIDLEDENDIVISGMSGKFPKSGNTEEFKDNLFNKINMTDDSEIRWRHTDRKMPRLSGKISDLSKFDAAFFKVNLKQAQFLDPQARLLMEHSYEAVMDSGHNPKKLDGSNTSVVIGCGWGEAEGHSINEKIKDGMGLTGCARSMLANRVSFALALNGPSLALDSACSSSLYALDYGFRSILSGECDASLVGATNLCLNPNVTWQFSRLGVLSKDDLCRPFDRDASGYLRSEANCVFFLQKRKDAKRVYATLVHTKVNCDGFKEEGITCPSYKIQRNLLKKFYDEIGIPLNTPNISFVEGHCTGTVVGDPLECRALDEAFCAGRKEPLLVGSVKSNMGHGEAAAGLCSMVKVILAMENQKIPANLNISNIRTDVEALAAGRMKVVRDEAILKGQLVPVSAFGFGGANGHALLKSNSKVKVNNGIPSDNLPRLVTYCGRTEEAVHVMLDSVSKQALDAEYIALLQNTQLETVPANIFRGYGIFIQTTEDKNAKCLVREVQHFSETKKSIVWVYSGMGSQWLEMGKDLMKIEIISNAITKCHKTLQSKGLDLKEIITSNDPSIFDNILHSFVGIVAIQIGLTDLLKALGLEPDFIIGHSLGELGCAYADGCFTAEETILTAYSRGIVSIETDVVFGSMAAVSIGYQQLKSMVPDGIEIACHNSSDSSTISGPAEKIQKFVSELKSMNIYVKEVAVSNIPYHSRYIAEMGPKLLSKLIDFIKTPKKRSSKWISTSIEQSKWNEPENRLSSAYYHTNNLLNPVLFEEGLKHLPQDALTIEIAPHGLLQGILKKGLKEAINIPLTGRRTDNNKLLMTALGKISMHGVDLNIAEIYPKIQFPVSRGTPMIAPNIKWDHSMDHRVIKCDESRGAERKVVINISETKHSFISGHFVDGRCLFPATGYLFLIWETFALMKGSSYMDICVEFEDIKFLRATSLEQDADVEFFVVIHPGTGFFEITEKSSKLVTGYIKQVGKVELRDAKFKRPTNCCIMQNRDFYKELRLRGYQYSGLFQSVIEASGNGVYGRIKWNNNWIAFMDCLLQIQIIKYDSRSLKLPTSIERITIDPVLHMAVTENLRDNVYKVEFEPILNSIRSGGIEIVNVDATTVGRRKLLVDPVLESYKFVPYYDYGPVSISDAARIIVQLALENAPIPNMKVVEVEGPGKNTILPEVRAAVEDLPLTTSNLIFLSERKHELVHSENTELSSQSGCYMIIATDCVENFDFIDKTSINFSDKGFLICRENQNVGTRGMVLPKGFKLISTVITLEEKIFVVYVNKKPLENQLTAIQITNDYPKFDWIDSVKDAMKKGHIVLFSENESTAGIIGLVNCLKKEPEGSKVQCIFIDSKSAPKFCLDNPLYRDQTRLELTINVLRNDQWGSYRHLLSKQELIERPVTDHCYVNYMVKSDLSSLKWIRGPYNCSSSTNKDLVIVQYSSLNFRDIMLATGKISADFLLDKRLDMECVIGLEYSGVTNDGKRVMGVLPCLAMATYVHSDEFLRLDCPEEWTLAEAATIPTAYMTVYTAFFVSITIEKGKSILIHSGCGGVGLAAIRVALAYGLEVFTTVSSEEKKNFLMKEYPQLKADNIGNSRDLSFEKMIKTRTGGKGVDLVLNSLAGEKLLASIRCLGQGGKFLEMGKSDMVNDTRIGYSCFKKEISIHTVMLDKVCLGAESSKKNLKRLIEKDIKSGIIKPLKTNIFDANQTEQAFRYLASGGHIGKIILKIRENELDKATLPITVVPRIYCSPTLSYIIPGGLGGFGLELADWLVTRGCRKLVLSSSRGISNQYQIYRIKIWESYGSEVRVNTSDISTRAGCAKLICDAMKLGPVGGIFNLAVVLKDSIFDNQSSENFAQSLGPKAEATEYLDEISRLLCPELQYFVVFSSLSCGRGNAGQSNYGMANSVMERIVEKRHEDKLPAKAIQWGAVGEVGLVADMQEASNIDLEIGGSIQQSISSCLEVMDHLMTIDDPIVSSMVVAEKRASDVKTKNAFDVVMNIMGIKDTKSLSMEITLSELGMDSLMTVEILQRLEREFDVIISSSDLRCITMAKLQKLSNVKQELLSEKSINTPVVLGMLLDNLGIEENSMKFILPLNSRKATTMNFLIPGIEGVAGDVWKELAECLTCAVFAVQHKNAVKTLSIDDLAYELATEILILSGSCKTFSLIGYSFGSVLSIKIASLLELRGMTGKLILIDGSHLYVKNMLNLIIPNISHETINDILSSLIEKFTTIFDSYNYFKNYSKPYVASVIQTVTRNIKLMFAMNVNDFDVLQNTEVYLLRAQDSALKDIEYDYGVRSLTKKEVEIKFIEGNHTTMLSSEVLKSSLRKISEKF